MLLLISAGRQEPFDYMTLSDQEPVVPAAKAYELYSRLRRADLTSAGNRIAIQSMFDGAPPFDDEFLKRTGQHRNELSVTPTPQPTSA